MARRGIAPLTMVLPLALSGCGGGGGALAGMAGRGGGGAWAHSAKAPGDLAVDEASCRKQAIEKVQASHQRQEAPKWMTRAMGTTSYHFDGNDASREQWHKSCLQAMGWSPTAAASLPSWVSPELVNTGLQGLQYIIR